MRRRSLDPILQDRPRGTFGMPHFSDKRYFKEYDHTLYGVDSPGVYKYDLKRKDTFYRASIVKSKSIP